MVQIFTTWGTPMQAILLFDSSASLAEGKGNKVFSHWSTRHEFLVQQSAAEL